MGLLGKGDQFRTVGEGPVAEGSDLSFVGGDGLVVAREQRPVGGLVSGRSTGVSVQLIQGNNRLQRPAKVAIISGPGDRESVACLDFALLGVGTGDLGGQQVIANAAPCATRLATSRD